MSSEPLAFLADEEEIASNGVTPEEVMPLCEKLGGMLCRYNRLCAKFVYRFGLAMCLAYAALRESRSEQGRTVTRPNFLRAIERNLAAQGHTEEDTFLLNSEMQLVEHLSQQEIAELAAKGTLTVSHIMALGVIPGLEQRQNFAKRVEAERLGVRELYEAFKCSKDVSMTIRARRSVRLPQNVPQALVLLHAATTRWRNAVRQNCLGEFDLASAIREMPQEQLTREVWDRTAAICDSLFDVAEMAVNLANAMSDAAHGRPDANRYTESAAPNGSVSSSLQDPLFPIPETNHDQ